MPQGATLQVKNFQLHMKAFAQLEPRTRKYVRETYRAVGDIVKHDVQGYFSPISGKTAAGFRTRVRQRGVAVEQTVRKTTGQHPEYGALQMRSLIRSQHNHEDDLSRGLERAMDRVADHFERRP